MEYQVPELEIIEFDVEDIIRTSGGSSDGNSGIKDGVIHLPVIPI